MNILVVGAPYRNSIFWILDAIVVLETRRNEPGFELLRQGMASDPGG